MDRNQNQKGLSLFGEARSAFLSLIVDLVALERNETERYKFLYGEYQKKSGMLERDVERLKRELALVQNHRDDLLTTLGTISQRLVDHAIDLKVRIPDPSQKTPASP